MATATKLSPGKPARQRPALAERHDWPVPLACCLSQPLLPAKARPPRPQHIGPGEQLAGAEEMLHHRYLCQAQRHHIRHQTAQSLRQSVSQRLQRMGSALRISEGTPQHSAQPAGSDKLTPLASQLADACWRSGIAEANDWCRMTLTHVLFPQRHVLAKATEPRYQRNNLEMRLAPAKAARQHQQYIGLGVPQVVAKVMSHHQ